MIIATIITVYALACLIAVKVFFIKSDQDDDWRDPFEHLG